MNIAQIEANLQKLTKSFNKDSFIYDLLLAYGQPKASIKRLQHGGLNLSKVEGEIIWKKKLFFRSVKGEDLHGVIDSMKSEDKALKQDPRFIIVTDFKTLLAIDRKTSDTLDVPIADIAKHFDFFLPWAGMEKAQHQNENPADVKAAERMAKLYDEIKKDNPIAKGAELVEAHNLNVFLSRLLFCFFAEDTSILKENQFTNGIASHTEADGNDLNTYLDKLFEVMNTEESKRKKLPAYLEAFPYVNGGLFRNKHHAPKFTRRSRQAIIDSGELDWSAINPDIFGSMIQAVITPEHRGGLGMHYTSVPNIMKVIEPLFLNELHEQFEAAKGNTKALNQLLTRIWNIKIFDPACGSGNFLIIAYKELRKLEMKIFKALNTLAFSNISLGNFYGIEIDDFAHEVATLSLWLAEHQMNQEFFKEFGRTKPALPLKETGNIVQGNATRVNWEDVCAKKEGNEIYVLGNPPFLGSRNQNAIQKEDMKFTFKDDYKSLDYVACWLQKGSEFIAAFNAQFAFVSTNSISQGEQVALIWPNVLGSNLEIGFAHQSFKWQNSAKDNAAVIVIIVGVRNKSLKQKKIFSGARYLTSDKINPYLTAGNTTYILRRSYPISDLPPIVYGSMPNDGGNLLMSTTEKDAFLLVSPNMSKFVKRFLGAKDFLNGGERWCFFIEDQDVNEARKNKVIAARLDKIKSIRELSTEKSTRALAMTPNRFYFSAHAKTDAIIIPRHSSERRNYIPMGFLTEKTIIGDSALGIYSARPWHFAVIQSGMHMVWVRAVCGRIKTDYRYSTAICYNTFPFPQISENQRGEIENNVYNILSQRENHSEKTLAQLYDPDKMPLGLKEAHHQLDLAVERCYRSKPFDSDEERLEYLFKLYEQMIAEEQTKGTLFEVEKKSKPRIKRIK